VSQPLDLLFLGSGNAFTNGRYWNSFLLNGRYLFDASPIALPHLKKGGIAPDDVDAVFISHFHGDHFFGLPFLLLEYQYETPRTKDLTIVGPPGLEGLITKVTSAAYPTVKLNEAGYRITFVEVNDGFQGEVAGLDLRAYEVDHVPELTCFGYRAGIGGRTLAYSGDSNFCDALVDIGQGADVYVVECACWDDDCGPHMGPSDIRELRRRLGPETPFVLTHLSPGAPDIGVENTTVASDLGRLTF
jgi:ribonuclease BN (tRNA processing enzyme)